MTLEIFLSRLSSIKYRASRTTINEFVEISTLEEEYLNNLKTYKKGDIITLDNVSIEVTNITKTNRLTGEPYYIYSGVILTEGLKPKNKKLYKYRSFNSFNLNV